ncbi:ATP-binding cassette domain-containing protein [Gordonia otitidis]|uniref:Sugar ABC transporter ATP-binding protein n=1 Tax=Gordonia otitidis (strain DSM 44809 / CCUG 52243 / JCM 12355 / NBRC 100426 / IFM 10032) TaxID=1108044 RepID=H5TU69_GORO1|nr:ATP-binding cassette domain-containing protein [Gordonia otitidis]GAB37027.1 putative sugar ABC transporter ATP-binding protein [Gordonia otitidis NBRC 100426]
MTTKRPLLEARGLSKRFGHVHVLRGVDFSVYPGEVTALIGDNGAGKSTLVKTLSGVLQPDDGQLFIDGEPTVINSPLHAREFGIETVYQDLALAPDLSAAENAYIGRELCRPGVLGRLGVLDKRSMRTKAEEAFRSLGTDLKDLDAPIAALSGGQRQSVAICRSAMWADRLVFMDEPTAALGVVQTRKVLDLIKRVAETGVAVVLISHNMPEILEVAHRVQVLRMGCRVADLVASECTVEDLVGAMTGALDGAA